MFWVNLETQSSQVPSVLDGMYNPESEPDVMVANGWRMAEHPAAADPDCHRGQIIWVQDPGNERRAIAQYMDRLWSELNI
jgi:hypothetical protein